MRLGISTASFFGRVSTELAFDHLRSMRVDATEVFLSTFSEYEKAYIHALVQRKGNVNVHSVHAHGTQFEPELFSTNLRARADAEIIFRKVCYAGFMLGAKYYTFHGPIKLKKFQYNHDYVRICDRINQLTEIAQSYGIKIAYENVHWAYGATPDYFREILPRCPHLYTTLDVKQAMQAGVDPIKFLDAMEGRIATIHLCDVVKSGLTCLPGTGKVNFEKFFTELYKRGINVTMLLEAYARDYKEVGELRASYDYLNSLLLKVRE